MTKEWKLWDPNFSFSSLKTFHLHLLFMHHMNIIYILSGSPEKTEQPALWKKIFKFYPNI